MSVSTFLLLIFYISPPCLPTDVLCLVVSYEKQKTWSLLPVLQTADQEEDALVRKRSERRYGLHALWWIPIMRFYFLTSALSLYLRNLETEPTQILSVDTQLLEHLHE